MRTTSLAVACAVMLVAPNRLADAATPEEAIRKLAWEDYEPGGDQTRSLW